MAATFTNYGTPVRLLATEDTGGTMYQLSFRTFQGADPDFLYIIFTVYLPSSDVRTYFSKFAIDRDNQTLTFVSEHLLSNSAVDTFTVKWDQGAIDPASSKLMAWGQELGTESVTNKLFSFDIETGVITDSLTITNSGGAIPPDVDPSVIVGDFHYNPFDQWVYEIRTFLISTWGRLSQLWRHKNGHASELLTQIDLPTDVSVETFDPGAISVDSTGSIWFAATSIDHVSGPTINYFYLCKCDPANGYDIERTNTTGSSIRYVPVGVDPTSHKAFAVQYDPVLDFVDASFIKLLGPSISTIVTMSVDGTPNVDFSVGEFTGINTSEVWGYIVNIPDLIVGITDVYLLSDPSGSSGPALRGSFVRVLNSDSGSISLFAGSDELIETTSPVDGAAISVARFKDLHDIAALWDSIQRKNLTTGNRFYVLDDDQLRIIAECGLAIPEAGLG